MYNWSRLTPSTCDTILNSDFEKRNTSSSLTLMKITNDQLTIKNSRKKN